MISDETETTPEEAKTEAEAVVEAAPETEAVTEVNIHAAEGIHPAAKPFLFLGHIKTRRNFIWLPLAGMIICVILGVFLL